MTNTPVTGGEREAALAKIVELVKRINIGMLTTESQGRLHSRPMSTNGEVEFDGDLWFFTYGNSHKVDQIQADPQVNVAFADNRNHVYISLTGTARLVRDKAKIRELWRPSLKLYFPKGIDEPDIALLKVSVDQAEYWDGSKSWLAQVVEMTRALATGTMPDLGENKKLNV